MALNKLPKVIIVGAINSGKSTLFNRLIGEQKAVTSKIPGTTRDWVSKETAFSGKPALLIDTAGFLEEETPLEEKVKKFWENIIQKANLFIFVADSRKGSTPEDKKILSFLRRFSVPIILVINKVDNPKLAEEKLRVFSELGIQDIVWISALLKKNLPYLEEKIASYLPKRQKDKKPETKIALIGRPNVGKSTLLNALTQTERALIDKQSGTTRDELEAKLNSTITLVDTPGLKRKSKVRRLLEFFSARRSLYNIKKADLVILVIDASEGIVHQEIKIASLCQKAGRRPIIVINKSDLVSKDKLKEVIQQINARLYFLKPLKIFPVSALKGKGITKLRKALKKTA
ncbi:ribosome biogenesis GTPase Der [bacterium]|nr:ribosome biogenesis GTPase Der [bacterium]